MNNDQLIEQAAELISRSRQMTALTGAGISTPSGVPDFRTPREGLWENVDVMTVAAIHTFRRNPQPFYDWLRPLLERVLCTKPNAAHIALADLERSGALDSVITQNIDLLHSRAGSQTIYELHGHLRQVVCPACHYSADAESYLQAFLIRDVLPVCPRCHSVMKPTVVLFGELLPYKTMRQAQQAAESSDVMLIAGTSLEVEPAGGLPFAAAARGARLIIVNKTPTCADGQATVIIRGDVAEILPALAQRVCELTVLRGVRVCSTDALSL